MIKNSQKQTGSAHAGIIVILVVALVGLLGFVFWQNFINKKNNSQTSSAHQPNVTTSDIKTTEQKVATTKVLNVSQFGVTMSKPSDDDSYHIIPQDDFSVYISNDKLDAHLNSGTDCEVKGVQLSKIPVASAMDNERVYSSAINGYKYGIWPVSPNFGQCSDNQALIATFSSVRDALINEIPSLK